MTAVALATGTVGAAPGLHVDLDAVAANTRLFAARITGEVMAVVKADGFGHGAADVARTALANGATRLGVTSLAEAFALRDEGLDAPILSWLNPVDADWPGARLAAIDIAVPSLPHLRAIAGSAPGSRVHLHVDIDMARDGVPPEQWPALCAVAAELEREQRIHVAGIMGHLARADEPNHPANRIALDRFAWANTVAATAGLRPVDRHLAATAATLTQPRARHTMCRIGAGLVGIDPSHTTTLRSALTLSAPVITIRAVSRGTQVGYGHTWIADRPTRLALLPLGYADGLPRRASSHAEVLLAGRRCPLVGRISMDMAVVDIGELPVDVGDIATVFGPGDPDAPTVRDWARWADTIEHEIVTNLGARLSRTHHTTSPGNQP